MPTQHPSAASLPELARDNRSLLWSKSIGIWIGLGLSLLIFGNVINIITSDTPYIGQLIEFVLGWGGLLLVVVSIISIFSTLNRLRTDSLIESAIHMERERVAARRPVE
jgi:hypothetical protein